MASGRTLPLVNTSLSRQEPRDKPSGICLERLVSPFHLLKSDVLDQLSIQATGPPETRFLQRRHVHEQQS